MNQVEIDPQIRKKVPGMITIHRVVLCLSILLWLTIHWGVAQRAPQGEVVKGESRILVRDDLEILTFETEEDYLKLEQLHEKSQKSSPDPATFTVQYLRSRKDGSVQPYAYGFHAITFHKKSFLC